MGVRSIMISSFALFVSVPRLCSFHDPSQFRTVVCMSVLPLGLRCFVRSSFTLSL